MSLWEDIAAGRIAATRFFLPDLSISLMGQDWATFTVPFDFEYNATFTTEVDPPYSLPTIDPLYVCFPDSWGADEKYPALLRLSCYFKAHWLRSGGTSDPVITYGFVGGDSMVTMTKTTATSNLLTRTWTSSLPTGPTALQLDLVATGGSWTSLDFHFEKTIGLEYALGSRYEFVLE